MGFKNFIKNNIGNILIIFGILIILFSAFQMFKWKFYQQGISSGFFTEEEMPTISKDFSKGSSEVNKEGSKPSNGNFTISIPKLKVKAAIVNGTKKNALKKGPGLYEISPLPNEEGGNVCIAGHRTTYGAWFRNVDKLNSGDEIILKLGNEDYVYKVERVFIVAKDDWSVTEPVGYSVLTLTSCHPLRSAKQRIVVRAKLNRIEK